MRIKDIHIHAFGKFHEVVLDEFSPGMNVIFGENEYGKTTLLHCIRRILFGFPNKKFKGNHYLPVKGGALAARLRAVMQNGDDLSITRRQQAKGEAVSVSGPWGNRQGQEAISAVIDHASENIFQNIFAFTIDELNDSKTLEGEEVKDRIYGAGLGLGRLSLMGVEDDLTKITERLFKPQGRKQELHKIYQEIRKEEENLKTIQEGLQKFDALSGRLKFLEENAKSLKTRTTSLERKRDAVRVKQEMLPHALELWAVEEELASMEDVVGFPEDGVNILSSLEQGIGNLKKQIDSESNDQMAHSIHREGLKVDFELLNRETDVLAVTQSTKEVRTALEDRIEVQGKKDRIDEVLQKQMEKTGLEWPQERFSRFQLNETGRSGLDRLRKELKLAHDKAAEAQLKLDYHREEKARENSARPRWPKGLGVFCVGLIALASMVGVGAWVSGQSLLWPVSAMMLVLALILGGMVRMNTPGKGGFDPLLLNLEEKLGAAKTQENEIRDRWRNWLAGKEFPETLSPDNVDRLLASIGEIQSGMGTRADYEERLLRMDACVARAVDSLSFLGVCGQEDTCVDDIPAAIESLRKRFEEAKAAKGEKDRLDLEIKKLDEKINRLKQKLAEGENELQQFLVRAGAEDIDDFKRKERLLKKREALSSHMNNHKRLIEATVGQNEAYRFFMESLKNTNLELLKQEEMGMSEEIDRLDSEREQINIETGETRSRIEQMESSDELLEKQTGLEVKKQKLNLMAGEWVAAKLALHFLGEARKKYEETRQPDVLKAAEAMFSHITDGAYLRIIKSFDSDDLLIEDANGGRKGIMQMSRGTREQLYLALRLGLIEEYEKRSEPLPVIMDDVFINFDDARGERVVELLARFAEKRQVIVLTCHKSSLDVYKNHGAHPVRVKIP